MGHDGIYMGIYPENELEHLHEEEVGYEDTYREWGPTLFFYPPVHQSPVCKVAASNLKQLYMKLRDKHHYINGMEVHVMRFPNFESYHHCYVVFVDEDTDEQALENATTTICGLSAPIGVPVCVLRSNPQLYSDPLTEVINPGDSLGIAGNATSTGTAGGFIYIDGDIYMLTCSHVVRDPGLQEVGNSVGGLVTSPSMRKLEEIRWKAKTNIDKLEKSLDERERSASEKNKQDERWLESRRTIRRRIASRHSILAKCDWREQSMIAVEVFADSGLGFRDIPCRNMEAVQRDDQGESETVRRCMDWALIKVAVDREISPNLINWKLRYWEGLVYLGCHNLECGILSAGELRPGMRTVKIGSSTGQTDGKYWGDLVCINFPELGGVTLYEHLIRDADTPTGFSQPGDSGSLVVDCSGRVFGLLIGGRPSIHIANTYFTPIEYIIQDICSAIQKPINEVGFYIRDFEVVEKHNQGAKELTASKSE